MSTDRETTRLVRSWLDEGVTRLPDRVLDAVLDQVPATSQRRRFWSAWRPNQMHIYAKLIAGAAAVILVAVVGYQLLPGSPGFGSPSIAPTPTTVPTPTAAALLASGRFTAKGAEVALEATGSGADVEGRMIVSDVDFAFTVDLECAQRSESGLLWIAGDVTESTFLEYAPVGTRSGIVLKPGSPVEALFIFQMQDPRAASCLAFLRAMDTIDPEPTSGPDGLEPIGGTVQLAP